MSFKDLQQQPVQAHHKQHMMSQCEIEEWQPSERKGFDSDQETELRDVFEDKSKFGFSQGDYGEPNFQGKLTFRQEVNTDQNSESNQLGNYNEYPPDSSDQIETTSTPKKEDNETDLQKKPSLVFRSGRREIIYFEDPEENCEHGDLAASIQNSSRVKNKREKKTAPSDQLTQKIIGQLRQQGNEFDEKALVQSIQLILRMPPQ